MMKRTIPMLLDMAAGIVMILAYFFPPLTPLQDKTTVWFNILAAVAFILGGAISGLADGRFRHDLLVFLGAHLAILIIGFAWLFLRTDLAPTDGAASLIGLLPGALAKSAAAALIVRPLITPRVPA